MGLAYGGRVDVDEGFDLEADESAVRILNGGELTSGFDYVVRLESLGSGNLVCTGVVIGDKLVLSAAHCVYKWDIADLQVCTKFECVKLTRIELPELYSHESLPEKLDLALMKLGKSLQNVKPIPVRIKGNVRAKKDAIGLGYGSQNSFMSTPTKTLRFVDMIVPANSECRSLKLNGRTANEDLVCGDGNFDGSMGGVCDGDSGGPLMVANKRGQRYIIGIASYVQKIEGKGKKGAFPSKVGLILGGKWILTFAVECVGICRPSFETVYMKLSSDRHRNFLLSAASKLGCEIALYLPGSPVTSTAPKPARDYASAIGSVVFPATPWDAKVCKSIRFKDVTQSSELIIAQEQLIEGELTIAWIDDVVDGNIRICVRGAYGSNRLSGDLRVWYAKIRLITAGNRRAMRTKVMIPIGENCAEAFLHQGFGSKAGVFSNVAYQSGGSELGVFVESDPATTMAVVAGDRVKICAHRSKHSKRTSMGTNSASGILVLNKLSDIPQVSMDME